MAEIQQNRIQESRAIKSGVTYNAPAKKEYDTPNQMVGSQYEKEADAWNKTADAIGSVGFIFAKMNENREKLIADDIKDEMDENHVMDMHKLVEQAKNTSIENLDFKDMIYGWEDRHTNDFKIGPNGADGKPSILVKGKALEDYDLPSTQKRELEEHYKSLEKRGTEWIFKNVPEIQQKKALFYLTRKGAKAQEDIEKIFRLDSNYKGGVDSIFTEDEEEQVVDRATGEPIIFNKTPYTNELGIMAQQDVNKILTAYDVEIAKLMDTGMIGLEDAIDLQKKFSVGVLFRQFQNDKIRNPEETFLKVTKHGYAINRDIRIGRSKSQKAIMYEVRLPSAKTDTFTSTWSARLQRESRAEIKKADADAILVEGQKIEELIGTKAYLDNPDNNINEVIKLYKSVGYKEKDARSAGLTWLAQNRTHDKSISQRLANNIRSGLESEIARNAEGLVNLLSYNEGEDKIAHDPKKLSKILLEKYGGKFTKPDGNKYTRKEEIDAIETITNGEIQTLINNKVAYDVIAEMDIVTTQWNGMLIDAGGRGHLVREFYDYDKGKGQYILNRQKMEDHPYRERFKSSADMGRVLMKLQNKLNTELAGRTTKTDTDIGIEQQSRFLNSLQSYATDQGNSFLSQTRVPDPDPGEMEKTAMLHPMVDHIKDSMWKTAKSLKHSEKDFQAMLKDDRRSKYLHPNQIDVLNAVEQDFKDIQDTLEMAYPHHKSSSAELKLAYTNMMRKNNNAYTGRAIGLVGKFVADRIQKVADPNLWSTAISECQNAEDITKCAVETLNVFNVDARKTNLVTDEIDAGLKQSLTITTKPE